jgi:hypothetical protein
MNLGQALRYGLRVLRKMLSLALGMGANSAIFSAVTMTEYDFWKEHGLQLRVGGRLSRSRDPAPGGRDESGMGCGDDRLGRFLSHAGSRSGAGFEIAVRKDLQGVIRLLTSFRG